MSMSLQKLYLTEYASLEKKSHIDNNWKNMALSTLVKSRAMTTE